MNIGLIAAICLIALNSHAVDLNPGDIRAPQGEFNAALFSVLHSERGDFYSNGNRQQGNPKITSTLYQVRLGHAFEIDTLPSYIFVQTAAGYIHPKGTLSGLEGDAGAGDTTVALAVWPYSNRETERYFGIAGYLVAPTGSYDHNRNLNMGQNRYQAALQAGFQTPVADSLHWSLALDTSWFSANTDFGAARASLKQRTLYAGQTGLEYTVTQSYAVAATYFYTQGGETLVNEVARNDVTRLQRLQLSVIATYPFGRFYMQYGGDLKTESGFIEKQRLILRFAKRF